MWRWSVAVCRCSSLLNLRILLSWKKLLKCTICNQGGNNYDHLFGHLFFSHSTADVLVNSMTLFMTFSILFFTCILFQISCISNFHFTGKNLSFWFLFLARKLMWSRRTCTWPVKRLRDGWTIQQRRLRSKWWVLKLENFRWCLEKFKG